MKKNKAWISFLIIAILIGTFIYFDLFIFKKEPDYKLAYMGSALYSKFWVDLAKSVNNKALEKNIIFDDYTPTGYENELQNIFAERILKEDYDAILWGLGGNVNLTKRVADEFNGGIFFIGAGGEDVYDGFVTLDDYNSGKVVGEYISSRINSSGRVLLVSANDVHKSSIERINGSSEVLEKNNIEYDVYNVNSLIWLVDSGNLSAISDLIVENNYAAIFVVWDSAAYDLKNYLEENKIEKNFILVGFDGLKIVLDEIQNGSIDATVMQPVDFMVNASFFQIESYLNGSLFDRVILLDGKLVTDENVDEYLES